MDIAVVQTKEGSSLQFLLVILLEWEEGGLGGRGCVCEMEAEGRGWLLVAVPQKAHAASFYIQRPGDASPSTALQTVWHSYHRRKPLERPQPPASSVERLCVYTVSEEPCARPYAPPECNTFLVLHPEILAHKI